jgi:hypothetical protein
MVEVLGGVGALLAALLLVGAAGRVLSRIQALERRAPTRPPQPYDDTAIWAKLRELQGIAEDQTLAIAEGIERVDRAEKRVVETVRRAKRRADQAGYTDPGVEAEVAALERGDGAGSEPGQLSLVQPDVAAAAETSSSVKGVSREQLQRARGWA